MINQESKREASLTWGKRITLLARMTCYHPHFIHHEDFLLNRRVEIGKSFLAKRDIVSSSPCKAPLLCTCFFTHGLNLIGSKFREACPCIYNVDKWRDKIVPVNTMLHGLVVSCMLCDWPSFHGEYILC